MSTAVWSVCLQVGVFCCLAAAQTNFVHVMVRRGRDEIGKVGGAAGEVSPRMASSTPPQPPPPPCSVNPGGAVAVDLDDEDAAVRAFDAALVRARLFVGSTP